MTNIEKIKAALDEAIGELTFWHRVNTEGVKDSLAKTLCKEARALLDTPAPAQADNIAIPGPVESLSDDDIKRLAAAIESVLAEHAPAHPGDDARLYISERQSKDPIFMKAVKMLIPETSIIITDPIGQPPQSTATLEALDPSTGLPPGVTAADLEPVTPYEDMSREELIECCKAHDAHHQEHHKWQADLELKLARPPKIEGLREALDAERVYLDSKCENHHPLLEIKQKFGKYPGEIISEAAHAQLAAQEGVR